MQQNQEENANIAEPARAGRGKLKLSAVATGVLLGFVVTVVAALVVMVVYYRGSMPVLTAERLEEAIARWETHGPASYDLDVIVSGRQPGRIHIEVRDREVTAMTRDGVTPSQRRTWEYWTVPEQFATISRDMESALDPAAGFGAPATAQVAMHAEFDPEFGYPSRYRRHVLGTPLVVEWEVERFAPVR